MSGVLPWQANNWARVVAARRENRLPHALLLKGPGGVGKSRFAEHLAQSLVCPTPDPEGDGCGVCPACRQAVAGSHPDILRIAPEERGRPIKIDAVRNLVRKSVLSAQATTYRVCLIDPADAMNRAAANALLKTLEEPTPRTVLLLVSARSDRLPATIRSRCQVMDFRPPDAAVAREWLVSQGHAGDLEECLQMTAGAPLRALEAAEQGWSNEVRGLAEDLMALKLRRTNPMQVVENWEKRSLNAVTAGLKRLCSDMVKTSAGVGGGSFYHPNLHASLRELVEDIDPRRLFRLADSLTECERSATNNANTQMTLEHLVNEWLQLTRPGER